MKGRMTKTVKNPYKALMLDCDGTTIKNGRDHLPSPKVKNAIANAQQKIHVGLATGRVLPEVQHIIELLNLSCPCVISGGAQIYDPVQKKIIHELGVNFEQVQKLVELSLPYSEKILLFNGEKDYFYKKDGFPEKVLTGAILRLTREKADELITKATHLNSLALHKVASWNSPPGTFDVLINDVAATKQYGIFEVAKILKIDTHEIIGVGDGYNDFPLLMACGLRIAMGNAPDELKAIADYIAPSVENDGVADVIEKYVLNT
jgi:5-amino-6-(5-phospho-D-ribitylamino)uracil phosphatase